MKYRHYAPKADMVVVELSEQTRQELREKRGKAYENLLYHMTGHIEKSDRRPEDYFLVYEVKKLAKKAVDEGHKVGILCTDETKEEYLQELEGFHVVRSMGERAKEETIAHNLYRVLREFDDLEADYIIAEGFSRTQLGQAL